MFYSRRKRETRVKTNVPSSNTYLCLLILWFIHYFFTNHIATPFHIFIFLYQRKKETRDKTNARLQILIFVSYFYSSFIHFLRITLQTPFIFLYFILREREKQETKQTPPRLQILIFASYFYSSFIDFLRITLQKRKKDKCEKYVF